MGHNSNLTHDGSTPTTTPSVMGHPRDMCHAVPSGTSGIVHGDRIGNGNWDRDAYFRTNYRRSGGNGLAGGTGVGSWRTNTGLSATPTRYQVYSWEIANRGTMKDGVMVLGPRVVSGNWASTCTAYGGPVCSQCKAQLRHRFIPGPSSPDRRRHFGGGGQLHGQPR